MEHAEQTPSRNRLIPLWGILLFGGSLIAGVTAAFSATDMTWSDRLYVFLIAGDIPMMVFAVLGLIVAAAWYYQKRQPGYIKSVRQHFAEAYPERIIRWVRVRGATPQGPIVAVLFGSTISSTPAYQYFQVDSESGRITDLGSSPLIPESLPIGPE
ncbi:hypothetical protein [Rubinisphaera italica]|uniref:Uncharacterized protein n=1 Tax=Rubinisphaera italica TaxID=2527969 RepID=A0A5C5XIG0_9PLAN|nr:hypothetical protein [Rubinisphaera italica]TWT62141.1 hypothetical protein Pan54_28810 [Rubinisphaera italica]